MFRNLVFLLASESVFAIKTLRIIYSKIYFRFKEQFRPPAGFANLCYLSGTRKGEGKKNKDCTLLPKPCQEALSQISYMRIVGKVIQKAGLFLSFSKW